MGIDLLRYVPSDCSTQLLRRLPLRRWKLSKFASYNCDNRPGGGRGIETLGGLTAESSLEVPFKSSTKMAPVDSESSLEATQWEYPPAFEKTRAVPGTQGQTPLAACLLHGAFLSTRPVSGTQWESPPAASISVSDH
ncbi:hypothetical protein R1flu_015009 [Riccia fluitans]|uniref:Uncharacterized protein n=1 Tax=Riccia fluitans TaxID=41844 RepID=A0ABD1YI41_9MARC